jgi:uncharacterized protein YdhG (YjbR/CyaY superfamily)
VLNGRAAAALRRPLGVQDIPSLGVWHVDDNHDGAPERHQEREGEGGRAASDESGRLEGVRLLHANGTRVLSHFMAHSKPAAKNAQKSTARFTDEERAAMKDISQERKIVWGKNREDDERAVLAKIAQLPEPDRSMGKRLHEIVKATAPGLSPRLWYGMPAYTKEGNVVCFFQDAAKFKARYAMLGFSDEANLDDGQMWPVSFALKGMNAAEETRIAALLTKALS